MGFGALRIGPGHESVEQTGLSWCFKLVRVTVGLGQAGWPARLKPSFCPNLLAQLFLMNGHPKQKLRFPGAWGGQAGEI